ncbi:MAG: nucleotide pyrophosphohydrolase [Candidatus Bathyarchaeota archaeon]|nr:nucleotide pyrophosphohydrolase [Candidatus Bathyarchaeota archaeon]
MNIQEFQDMMRRIYFHRDSERGVRGTYNWLIEEVEELGAALEKGDEKSLRAEFADVLAWLASLANVANVDLEASALQKYAGKCPRCLHALCNCQT